MTITVNNIIRRKDANEGGRIGGFFRFRVGGQVFGISCNHVIANLNDCNIGDELTDENNSLIGTLSQWIILDSAIIPNGAEFALFKPTDGFDPVWLADNASFKPDGFAAPNKGIRADFVCGDWVRHGLITETNQPITITWNGNDFNFDCVEITAQGSDQFSLPGHSGGAVFVGNNLLGIILAINHGTVQNKTYVVPYVNGILNFANLLI